MQRKVKRHTEGSIKKSIFSLAIPLIISNLFNISLEITDAIFVGKLGADVLAAVSMAGTLIFFFSTFIAGVGIGVVAMLSRSFGEKNFEKADHIATQAFYLGILLSICIGVLGFIFSKNMLKFLGAKEQVLINGVSYSRIIFLGILLMFFMLFGSAVFQAAGDTLTPTKIAILTTMLNIVLDPMFIFGLLGFPRLEVNGAAIATVLARSIGSLVMLSKLLGKNGVVHIKIKQNLYFDFKTIKKIFNIGIPGAIQMFLRSFSMIILMKLVSYFGNVVVAAYGVGIRIHHLFLFPGFGFGTAASTMVGQNLGAQNPQRAEKSALKSVKYYFLLNFVVGIFVFTFCRQIAKFFNSSLDFIETASLYFRYIAVGGLLLPFGVVLNQSLQGAAETFMPMLTTVFSLYIVQIPIAYFLSNHVGLKEKGIWLAGLLSNISNAILASFVFFSGNWKNKKI